MSFLLEMKREVSKALFDDDDDDGDKKREFWISIP